MARRLLLAVLLAAGSGCATGNVGDAILMSGIAAASAGISRAQGGCYAACPPGTTCNTATGLCDSLPCRGQCGSGQRCERAPIEHCVLDKPATMQIDRPVDQTGILMPASSPLPEPPPAPAGQQ
ncbi:MAG TPA: hypothetical protein VGK67_15165 [Myxococcales bacterium]|jgi:hypothetical protein